MNEITDMSLALKQASARIDELEGLICAAMDNLGDMPISDEWAERWCLEAHELTGVG